MSRTVEFVSPTQLPLDNVLSEFRWSLATDSPTRITYTFADQPQDYLLDREIGYHQDVGEWSQPFRTGFGALDEAQRETVVGLLQMLERAIGVEFVEVEDARAAHLRFSLTDLGPEQAHALAYPPNPDLLPFRVDYEELHRASGISSDIWLHHDLDATAFLAALPAAIGTALGLSATTKNGFSVSEGSTADPLPEALDYVRYTVMSEHGAAPGSTDSGMNAGFAAMDLEALRYLYGPSHDSGNDLYIIDRSIDDPLPGENLDYGDSFSSHNFLNSYLAIADSGGRNVLVIDVEADLVVDLNPDSWSDTRGGNGSGASSDPNLYLDPDTRMQEVITVDGNDRVTGNDLDNRIQVRGGNDWVDGGPGNDWVQLGSGDDEYRYSGGGDQVYAGSGQDLVHLNEQNLGRYKLVTDDGVLTISDLVSGDEARFFEFERAGLAGESTSLSQAGNLIQQYNLAAGLFQPGVPLYQSTIAGVDGEISAEEAQLYRMYYGSLGRAPDRGGFDFWLDTIRTGTYSIEEVADRFVRSDEFIGLADSNDSGNVGAEEFVTHMYRNVFGRAPDPGGFAWWIGQLFTIQHTQGSAFLNMVQSDEFVSLTAATVADFFFL